MKLKKFSETKTADFDFQIHTNQTDGSSSPQEIIEKAEHMKLGAIAFTEHVRESTEWFSSFRKNIERLKAGVKNMDILTGIETKTRDFSGKLDAKPSVIAEADIVLGVVHRYPNEKGGYITLEDIEKMDKDEAARTEFDASMGLLDNDKVDVLGHPFGVYKKYHSNVPRTYLRDVILKAKKKAIAVEINTKYCLSGDFFRMLAEINPLVSIGSDAHEASEVGRSFDKLNESLRKWN